MLAITAFLAACSSDGYWDKAPETEGKYSFDQASQNYSVSANEEFNEVTVRLTRTHSVGDETLPIVAEFSDEALSGASSVTFANGSNTAEYVISVGELEIGVPYTATLTMDGASLSTSGIAVTKISIFKDYNWLSVGTAQVYSSWVGNWGENGLLGSGIKVPVEKAEGVDGLYRLNSMYYYMEPSYCPKKGSHIQFYVDEDYNPVGLPRMQMIGEESFCLMFLTSGDYAGAFFKDEDYYIIQTVMGKASDTGVSLSDYENIAFVWNK